MSLCPSVARPRAGCAADPAARFFCFLPSLILGDSHIAAFEEALGYNDLMPDTSDPTPHSPRSTAAPSAPQSPMHTSRLALSSRDDNEESHAAAAAGSSAAETGTATATRRRSNRLGLSSAAASPNAASGSGGLRRSPSSQTVASQGWEKVEKVKALSDFAPVHQRVAPLRRGTGAGSGGSGANGATGGSRRGSGGGRGGRRAASSGASGWSYQIGRWPLLGFIFLVIFLEFLLYVLVRQVVNVWEALVGATGSSRKRYLTNRLRNAQSWEEWKSAAAQMDDFLGFDEWKENDEAREYDWPLVRKVRRSLVHLRKINDVRGLMGVLEICLRNNFAGTEGMRIYSEVSQRANFLAAGRINLGAHGLTTKHFGAQAFIGTKRSIESESRRALGLLGMRILRTHFFPQATSMKSRNPSTLYSHRKIFRSRKNVASTAPSTRIMARRRCACRAVLALATTTSASFVLSSMPT